MLRGTSTRLAGQADDAQKGWQRNARQGLGEALSTLSTVASECQINSVAAYGPATSLTSVRCSPGDEHGSINLAPLATQ